MNDYENVLIQIQVPTLKTECRVDSAPLTLY